MKTSLLKGLDKEEARDVRANFKESLVLRKHLIKHLKDSIESVRKETSTKVLYDEGNWALRQADAIGVERTYRRIISLLEE